MPGLVSSIQLPSLSQTPQFPLTGFLKYFVRDGKLKVLLGNNESDLVLDRTLDGFVQVVPSPVVASDSVLQAIEKLYAIVSEAFILPSHTHPYLLLAGGVMANTNLINNLNADLLDGRHGIEYSLAGHTHVVIAETDPVFTASVASGITSSQITNWDNSFSWGNHALAGYALIHTHPYLLNTDPRIATWNQAYAWGNHVGLYSLLGHIHAQYLTSFTEIDPVFIASPAGSITTSDISKWNTAFSWGNHANLYELKLGNPTVDGQVLSSTALGVRNWITLAANYWVRAGAILSPTTADDVISILSASSTTTLSVQSTQTGTQGINAITAVSAKGYGVYGTGYLVGVVGSCISGKGVQGISTNGTGVHGQSSTSMGIYAYSATGDYAFMAQAGTKLHIYAVASPATNNIVHEMLSLRRTVASNGAGTDGIGASISFNLANTNGGGTLSGQIINKYTTATAFAEVSSFEWWLANNGTLTKKMELSGAGSLSLLRGQYQYHRQSINVDTDGDWRTYADALGYHVEYRAAGAWVEKQSIPITGIVPDTYTNATPMPVAVGGLEAGNTFNAATMDQMFTDLLYPYQYPALTAFSITSQTTLFEVGVNIDGTKTFTWSATNLANINASSGTIRETGTNTVIKSGITLSALTTTQAMVIPNTVPIANSYRLEGTNSKSQVFVSNLFSIKSIYPIYYGKVNRPGSTPVRPVAGDIAVTAGTKQVVLSTGDIAIAFNSLSDDYFWFAIPASSALYTKWFITTLNSGNMGGAVSPGGLLFPDPETVNLTSVQVYWNNISYRVYISNYRTAVGTVTFKRA